MSLLSFSKQTLFDKLPAQRVLCAEKNTVANKQSIFFLLPTYTYETDAADEITLSSRDRYISRPRFRAGGVITWFARTSLGRGWGRRLFTRPPRTFHASSSVEQQALLGKVQSASVTSAVRELMTRPASGRVGRSRGGCTRVPND